MSEQRQDINDIAAIMQEQILQEHNERVKETLVEAINESYQKGFEDGKNYIVDFINKTNAKTA